MPCFHPSRVPVRRKSAVSATSPRVTYTVVVPCGWCAGCRYEASRQWMVRAMHERAMHRHAWFLTLTYNDESLPENGSLNPLHLKRFFKDLRRSTRFRYYAVGEYGSLSSRPHYHALLFGPDFLDKYPWTNGNGSDVWRSPFVESLWRYGNSELGTLTYASAAYVTGYVRKKLRAKDAEDRYLRADPDTGELFPVTPEFSRMSLRPAIGRRWIEKYWRDVYPRDFVVVNGRECKPPRYYDKFMDLEDSKGGSAERRKIMNEVRAKRWDEMDDDIKDRAFDELEAEGRRHLRAVAATNAARDSLRTTGVF